MSNKISLKYKYMGICFLGLIIILLEIVYFNNGMATKPLTQIRQPININKAQNLLAFNISDRELAQLINDNNTFKVSPPKVKENHQDIFITPQDINETKVSSLPIAVHSHSLTSNDSILQPCMYNNQPYVPGDMIKTDSGWIRCTPTVSFVENNSTTAQKGEAVWAKVQ
jgi:hypothetical protein